MSQQWNIGKKSYLKKENKDAVWKYDIGKMENISSVMGHSYIEWFVPTPPPKGTGMEYKTRDTHEPTLASDGLKCSHIKIEIDSDDDYDSQVQKTV